MSKDNAFSFLVNDSHLQELPVNSLKGNQSPTSPDCFYVRSHFRKRSKSVPLSQQHQAEMEFIKSIHDLKIPMYADQYEISDTKTTLVTDHDPYVDSAPDTTTTTSMDVNGLNVDNDSDSEPEGDDTMTIASLMNPTNINIDSQKNLQGTTKSIGESNTAIQILG
jgi:hypothetical protein